MEFLKGNFKFFTILDRFAFDLLKVLDEILQKTFFNQDELCKRLLFMLNKEPYFSQLLFIDFNRKEGDQRYDKIFFYLTEVLVLYRLGPTNNLKGRPGNMHLLTESLCKKSAQCGWDRVSVRRMLKTTDERTNDDFFIAVEKVFKNLYRELENNLSEVSKGQREKYGRLWLILDGNMAELPEEMSLFDMLKGLPVPLKNGLLNDSELLKLMSKVLSSINERYMLLRACGLNPERWLYHDKLSIGKLKDMRKLRKYAIEKSREREQNMILYEQSFRELQGNKKKFAGCSGFDEFRQTELGESFLRSSALYDYFAPDDSVSDVESLAADESGLEDKVRQRERIDNLIEIYPKPFQKDKVITHFFRRSLGDGLPLYAEGKFGGILDDKEFRQLVTNDKRYANLDDESLAKKIYKKAKEIIQSGRKKCKKEI